MAGEEKFDLNKMFTEALIGESVQENVQSTQETEDVDNEEQKEQEEEGNTSEKNQQNDAENEEQEDDEEEDEDDIFGISKSSKKKPAIKLDFEPQKEIVDLISKKYGVNDLPTFLNSADTWRKQAQEGEEIKKNYEAILSDLDAMPPDLARAVNSWAKGEDWTSAVQQRLDFTKPFEKQDVNGLVQQYFPEEFEEERLRLEKEEITQEEFERAVKTLGGASKKLFQRDKDTIEKERVQYEENQKKILKEIKTSALDSVKTLSKTYPHFSGSELKKIENILVEGKAEALIYEANGTYKENVAESIAYILYGSKMMDRIKKLAERKGESKAREEIVDTSDKRLKASRQNSSKDKVDLSSIQHLQGLNKKSPFQNRIVK